MTSAIQVNGLSKTFRVMSKRVQALQDINLSVATGEIFGFLGPNGAGKTTLIKILMGMLHHDAGEVLIAGKSPFDRQAKRILGYFPERPYLHDFLTGEEFLRFHGRLMAMEGALLSQRITEVLGLVDMERGRNLELRKYSKGMLQRIGLAQALLHDPEVLILDEPMSGLDPVGRREVRELILRVSKLGKTVFFSTHIVSDIEAICTNVGFINKGRLRAIPDLSAALGRTLKSMEVEFQLPEATLKRLPQCSGARAAVDGWVKDFPVDPGTPLETVRSQVDELVGVILKEKGVLKAVIPRKSNLEELFFEDMP
jgi:ABC-2 type transport system ATP-binding protein